MLTGAISKLAATSVSENQIIFLTWLFEKTSMILQKSWKANPVSDIISCSPSTQPITPDISEILKSVMNPEHMRQSIQESTK